MEEIFNGAIKIENKLFLHLHTCYSLLDGLSKPEKVAKKIKELGYTHVSISDHGTVGGCLEFYQACKKEGITPVIGCEVYVKLRDNPNNIKERSHLVLLCKNLTGWKNLLRLTRESYNHFYRKPMVTLELLEKYKEGLIATSACFAGVVAQFINTEIDFAVQNLDKMKEIFGEDFYIELQPNSLQEQVQLNVQLYHLAKQRGVKTVIGIDSHYTNKEDAQAQETLLGINTKAKITDPIKKEMYAEIVESEIDEDGDTGELAPDDEEVEDAIENEEAKGLPADLPPVKQRKPKYRFSFGSYDFWIMSTDEIVEFWNKHHNRVGNSNQPEFHMEILAQSFRNHNEIISKLEEFTVEPDRNGLSMDFQINATPKFLAFHERQADKSDIKFNYLRYLCNLGIRKLGIDKKPNKDAYIARIKHELSEIKEANIVDYFLIVWDVVRWMRSNGLETGIGRGSAAGSLSAYVLGIHGIDSIEYDLLWERFYNAGRKNTLPDIDLDTPSTKACKVIKYLIEKYGEDKVASICNYAYFSPKTTIKSVLSYYNFEFQSVNDVVKSARPNDTSDEYEAEEKDYDVSLDQDMKEMEDMLHNKHIKELVDTSPHKDLIHRDCLAIVGGIKNSSQHASGVVITKAPLLDLCPVTGRPGDMPKTGWDGGQLDAMGFMKLDVLKVKLLDIIADTKANIYKNKTLGYDGITKHLDWKFFDKTDAKTIDVFAKGNTTGCFQFDVGTEMQHLCKKFGLKSFADVCALSALGRPGAKNFIPDYIQNRNRDESQIELLDKRLLPILKPTNFVLVYQEQQMRMCVDLAGFTLKEADNLRKVVAKKKVDKIPEMKEKFVNGYVNSLCTVCTDSDGNSSFLDESETMAKNEQIAEKIWDKYFSECAYLFNKSHAVAYSVNSFATAYLKAHFPYEFMSAVLNHNNVAERNGKRTKRKRDKFVPYIWEVMRMDLGFVAPHYIHSDLEFTAKIVKGKMQMVAGLDSIKKISDKACMKVKEDPRKALCETLTKAQYEPLILAGVFDGWEGLNRRQILETVKSYRSLKEQWKKYDEKQGKYEEAVVKFNEHLASGKKSKRKAPEVPIAPLQQKGTVNPVLVQDFGLDEKIRFEEEYLGYAPSSPDFKWMGYVIECTTYSYRQRESWQDGQEILIYGKISELTEKESTRDASEKYARVKIKAKDSFFTATAWNREYDKFKERLSDNMNSHLFKCRVKFVPDKKDTSKMIKMLNIISVKGIEEK